MKIHGVGARATVAVAWGVLGALASGCDALTEANIGASDIVDKLCAENPGDPRCAQEGAEEAPCVGEACGAVSGTYVAVAGPDVVARVGEAVVLSGAASTGPAGAPLAYQWELALAPPGSKMVVLTETTSPDATIVPDVEGTFIIALTVFHSANPIERSQPDVVNITVDNDLAEALHPEEGSEGAELPGCGPGVPCPEGLICDTAAGACELCLNDGHCGAGEICLDKVCVPEPDLPVACENDEACAEGNKKVCHPEKKVCVACLDASHCKATEECTAENRCVPDCDKLSGREQVCCLNKNHGCCSVEDPADNKECACAVLGPEDPACKCAATGGVCPEEGLCVIDAGEDKVVAMNSTVVLEGKIISCERLGDPSLATVSWRQVAPPDIQVSLTDTDTLTASFQAPGELTILTFELEVTDDPANPRRAVTDTVDLTVQPAPPVADCGPDQTVTPGTEVVLSGARSRGLTPTGKLSFKWKQVSEGVPVPLAQPYQTEALVRFVAPDVAEPIVFELTITDDFNAPTSCRTKVTVDKNLPTTVKPVAVAGPDRRGVINTQITLDGSASFDDGGKALQYMWFQRRLGNEPLAALTNTDKAVANLALPSAAAQLSLGLLVFNGMALSEPDFVAVEVVTAKPPAPVAHAGLDATYGYNQLVTLDGSGSFHPAGLSLNYKWTQVSGLPAELQGADTPFPTFLAPKSDVKLVFHLAVDDGLSSSLDTESAPEAKPTVEVTISKQGPQVPVAVITGPMSRKEITGSVVELDGSKSYDPAGAQLSYRWVQTSGPAVQLSAAVMPKVNFTAPGSTAILEFQLVVSNGLVNSAPAFVRIELVKTNSSPVADAGGDMVAVSGDLVFLNGAGSKDPDGDAITFKWKQTVGQSVALSGDTSPTPSFIAPTITAATELMFELIVTDPLDAAAVASVKVAIQPKGVVPSNQPPVANAGKNQDAGIGSIVTLDGSGSSDPDGTVAAYQWFQVSGIHNVVLDDAAKAKPSFTAPLADDNIVFGLVVTDNKGASSAVSLTSVSIGAPPQNPAPVCKAGVDQKVRYGTVVTLDGSQSGDPNGDVITYAWSGPAPINNAQAPIANFVAPETAAIQTYTLTVSDGVNQCTDGADIEIIGPCRSQIQCQAQKTTLTANGTDTTKVTCTSFADQRGKPVFDGELIKVQASLGVIVGTDLNPATPEKELGTVNGGLAFDVSSTTAVGTSNITITSVKGTCQAQVTLAMVSGPPTACTLSAAPATVIADGTSVVELATSVMKDSNQNIVSDGTLITVSTTAGSIVEADADATTPSTVEVKTTGGVAKFHVLASTVVNYQVTGKAKAQNNIECSANFQFLEGPWAKTATCTPAPASVARGGSSTITCTSFLDAFDHPVPSGTEVTVAVTGGILNDADVNPNIAGTQLKISSAGSVVFTVGADQCTTSIAANLTGVDGATGTGAATVAVTPGVPKTLHVTSVPTNWRAVKSTGSVGFEEVAVESHDSCGDVASADNSTVVRIQYVSGGSSSLVVSGTNPFTLAAGKGKATGMGYKAIQNNLVFKAQYVSGQTVAVTDSSNFTINSVPGTPVKIILTAQPPNPATSQTAFTVSANIQDNQDYVVTTDSSTQITVALASGSTGTLGGTLTKAVTSGAVSFTNLTVDLVGNKRIDLTSTGLTAAQTNLFTVNNGAAAAIRFEGATATFFPASFKQNQLFVSANPARPSDFRIEVTDASGNLYTVGAQPTVTVSAYNAGAPLGTDFDGTKTKTAVSGVVTFNDIRYPLVQSALTVHAVLNAGSNPVLNSANINITAGTPTSVGVTQQPPASVTSESPFQVKFAIFDEYGLTLKSDNSSQITVSKTAGDGALTGTLIKTVTAGVADFDDLKLDLVDNDYKLQGASGVLTPGSTSPDFSVVNGAAKNIAFEGTFAASYKQNQTIAQTNPARSDFRVKVTDNAGNLYTTGATVSVTVAAYKGGNPLATNFAGTLNQNVSAGFAAFNNVSYPVQETNVVIHATLSSPAATADSGSFNVTQSTLTSLSVSTQPPGSVDSGVTFTVAIDALDEYGMRRQDDNTTSITLSKAPSSGSGTLGGTLTKSVSAGRATFSDLTWTSVGSGKIIRATAAGIPTVDTNSFTVNPGNPASVAFVTGFPSDFDRNEEIQDNNNFDFDVEVRDVNGNLVTDQNVNVTVQAVDATTLLALSPDFSGSKTQGSGSDGIATFNGITYTVAYLTGMRIKAYLTGAPGVSATSESFIINAVGVSLRPSLTFAIPGDAIELDLGGNYGQARVAQIALSGGDFESVLLHLPGASEPQVLRRGDPTSMATVTDMRMRPALIACETGCEPGLQRAEFTLTAYRDVAAREPAGSARATIGVSGLAPVSAVRGKGLVALEVAAAPASPGGAPPVAGHAFAVTAYPAEVLAFDTAGNAMGPPVALLDGPVAPADIALRFSPETAELQAAGMPGSALGATPMMFTYDGAVLRASPQRVTEPAAQWLAAAALQRQWWQAAPAGGSVIPGFAGFDTVTSVAADAEWGDIIADDAGGVAVGSLAPHAPGVLVRLHNSSAFAGPPVVLDAGKILRAFGAPSMVAGKLAIVPRPGREPVRILWVATGHGLFRAATP